MNTHQTPDNVPDSLVTWEHASNIGYYYNYPILSRIFIYALPFALSFLIGLACHDLKTFSLVWSLGSLGGTLLTATTYNCWIRPCLKQAYLNEILENVSELTTLSQATSLGIITEETALTITPAADAHMTSSAALTPSSTEIERQSILSLQTPNRSQSLG